MGSERESTGDQATYRLHSLGSEVELVEGGAGALEGG